MKLHCTFSHPEAGKLYNLLKVAYPWEKYLRTKEFLEDMVRHRDICEQF